MADLRKAAQALLQATEGMLEATKHLEPCLAAVDEAESAITAIRAALAEPAEHQDSSWCMRMNGCKTKCEDCPDEVPKQSAEQPMFWYRPRSDGCYEGPIHNAQIEQVRKESGGWHPLYTAPQPAKREPLTEDQKWRMYQSGCDIPGTMAGAYLRGVSDTEAAHGITKE